MAAHGQIIIIKSTGEDGSCFPLITKTCSFGKDPDCDIRIQKDGVASQHCIVEVQIDSKVFLKRLSENSTLLNGKPLSMDWIGLKHKDIIQVSDRSFRWEYLPGSIHIDQDAEICRLHLINSNKENTPINKSSIITSGWKNSEKKVIDESSISHFIEDIGELKPNVTLVEHAITDKSEISRRRSKRFAVETVEGHTSVLHVSLDIGDAVENVEQQSSTVELNVKPQISKHDYIKPIHSGKKSVNRKSFSDTAMRASSEQKNLDKTHSSIYGEDIRESMDIPKVIAADLEEQKSIRKGHKVKEFFVESFGSNNSLLDIGDSEKLEEENFNCDINEEELLSPKYKMELREITKSSKNTPKVKKKILETPAKLNSSVKDFDELHSSYLSENLVESMQSQNVISVGHSLVRKQIKSKIDVEPSETVTCPFNEISSIASQLGGSEQSSSTSEDCEGYYKLKVMVDSKTQPLLNLDEKSPQTRKSILITPGRTRSAKKLYNDVYISNLAEDMEPELKVKHGELIKSQKSVKFQRRSRFSIRAIEGITPLRNTGTNDSKLIDLDQSSLCNSKFEEEKTPKNGSILSPKDKKSEMKTLNESTSIFVEDTSKLKKTPVTQELKSEAKKSVKRQRRCRFTIDSIGASTSPTKDDKGNTSEYDEMVKFGEDDQGHTHQISSNRRTPRIRKSQLSTSVILKSTMKDFNESHSSSNTELLQTPNRTKISSLETLEITPINTRITLKKSVQEENENTTLQTYITEQEQDLSVNSIDQYIPELLASSKKSIRNKWSISSTSVGIKPVKSKLNTSCVGSVKSTSGLLQTPNLTEEKPSTQKSGQSRRSGRKSALCKTTSDYHQIFDEKVNDDMLDGKGNSISEDTLEQHISIQSSQQGIHTLLTSGKKTNVCKKLISSTPKLKSVRKKLNESSSSNPLLDIAGLLQTPNNTGDELLLNNSVQSLRKQRRTVMGTLGPHLSNLFEEMDMQDILEVDENSITFDTLVQDKSVQSSHKDNPELFTAKEKTPKRKLTVSKTPKLSTSDRNTVDNTPIQNPIEDKRKLLPKSNVTNENSMTSDSLRSLKKERKSTISTSSVQGHTINKSVIVRNGNTIPDDKFKQKQSEQISIEDYPEINTSCKDTPLRERSMSKTHLLLQSEKRMLDESCTSNAVEDIAGLLQTPNETRNDSLRDYSIQSLRKGRKSIKGTPGHNISNPMEDEESIIEDPDNSIPLHALEKDISVQEADQEHPEIFRSAKETPESELQIPKSSGSQENTLDDLCISNRMEGIRELLQTPEVNKNESIKKHSVRSLRRGRNSIMSTPVTDNSVLSEDKINENFLDESENAIQEDKFKQKPSEQISLEDYPEINTCKETPLRERSISKTPLLLQSDKRMLDESCTSNAVEDIAGLLKTPHETRNDSLRNNSMRSLRKGRKSTKGTPGHSISNLKEGKESNIEDQDNSIPLEILAEDISLHASHQEHSEIVRSGKKTLKKKLSALRTPKFSESKNNALDDSCISNHVEDVRELLQTPEVNKDESMKQHFVRSLRRASNFEISTPVADNSDLLEDKIKENMPDRSENTIQEDDFKHEQSEQILLQDNPEMNTSCKKTPFRKMSMSNTQLVMQSEKRILDESCTSNAVEDIAGLLQTPHETRNHSLRNNSMRSLRKGRESTMGTPGHNISSSMEDKESIIEDPDNSLPLDALEKDISFQAANQEHPDIFRSAKRTPKSSMQTVSQINTLDDSCISNRVEGIRESLQTPEVNKDESMKKPSVRNLRRGSNSIVPTPIAYNSDASEDKINENFLDESEKSIQEDEFKQEQSEQISLEDYPEINISCKETSLREISMSKTPLLLQSEKRMLDESCTSNAVEDIAGLLQTPNDDSLDDSCISNRIEGIRELLQTPEVKKDESIKKHSVRSLRRGRNSIMSTPVADNSVLSEDKINENFLDESENAIQEDKFKQKPSEQISLEDYPEINTCKETPLRERSISKTPLLLQSDKRMLDESCTSNAVEDIAGLLKTPHETRNDSLRNNSMRSLRKGRKSTKGTPGHSISNLKEGKESNIEDQDNSIPLEILAEDISLHASHQEHSEIVRSGKKTLKKKLSALRTPKFSESKNNALDDSCISNHVEDVRELLQTPEVNKDESMKQHFVRSLRRASNFEISTPVADNSDLLEDKIKENMPDRSENTIQEDDFKHEQSEQILLQDNPEMNTSCKKTPFRKMSMSNTQLVMQSEKRILDESCTSNAVEDIAGLLQTPHETRNHSLRNNSMRSLRKGRESTMGTPGHNISSSMEDKESIIEDPDNSLPLDALEKDISFQAANQEHPDIFRSAKRTPKSSMQTVSQINTLDDSCISNRVEGIRESLQTPEVNKDESMKKPSVRNLRRGSNSIVPTPIAYNSDASEDKINENFLDESEKSIQEDEFKQEQSEQISLEDYPEINISCKETSLREISMSKTPLLLQSEKRMLDESCTSNAVEDIAGLLQTPNDDSLDDSCISNRIEGIRELLQTPEVKKDESIKKHSVRSLRRGRNSIMSTPVADNSVLSEDKINENFLDESENAIQEDKFKQKPSEQISLEDYPEINTCKETPLRERSISKTPLLLQSDKRMLDESCTSNAVEDIAGLLKTPHETRNDSLRNNSMRSLRKGRKSTKGTPGHNISNLKEGKESNIEDQDNSIPLEILAEDISLHASHQEHSEIVKSGKKTLKKKLSALRTPKFSVSKNNALDDSCISNHVEDVRELLQTPEVNKDESSKQHFVRSLRRASNFEISTPVADNSDLLEDKIKENMPDWSENTIQEDDFKHEQSEQILLQDNPEMKSSCKKTPFRKMSMSNTQLVMQSEKRILDESCTSNAVEDIAGLLQTPHETRNHSLRNNSMRSLRKGRESTKGTPGHNISSSMEDKESIIEDPDNSLPLDALEKDISFQAANQEHPDIFRSAKRTPKSSMQTVSHINTLDDSCISNRVEGIRESLQTPEVNKDESMKKPSVRNLRRGSNSIVPTPIAYNSDASEDKINENFLDESEKSIQEDEFKQEQSEQISLEDYPEINISCKETSLREISMSKTPLLLQSEKRMLDESCTSNAVEDIAGLLQTPNDDSLDDSCISNRIEGLRELLQTPEVNKDESIKKHSVRSLRRGRNSIMSTPVADNSVLSEDKIIENFLDESENAIQEDKFKQKPSEQISLEDYPEINTCKETPLRERSISKTPLLLQSDKRMLDESCTSNAVEDIAGLLKTPHETRNDSLRNNSMRSLRKGRKSTKGTPGHNISNLKEGKESNIEDQDNSIPLEILAEDISLHASHQEHSEIVKSGKKTLKKKLSALRTPKFSVSKNNALDDSCISNHVEDVRELLQTPEANKDESMKQHFVRSLRRASNFEISTPVADNSDLLEDKIKENIPDRSENTIQEDDFKHEQSEQILLQDNPEMNISCKKTPFRKMSMSNTRLVMQSEKRILDESCTSNTVEDIAGLLQTPHETRNHSLRNNSMRSLRKGRESTMGTPGHNISSSMEDKESIIEDPDNSLPLDALEKDISFQAANQEHPDIFRSAKRTPKSSMQTVSQINTLDDSCISNRVEGIRESLQTPEVNKDESMKKPSVRNLRRGSNSIVPTPIAYNSDASEDKINENFLDESEKSIQEDEFKQEQSEQISLEDYPEINISCKETSLREISMSKTPLLLQSEKRMLDESCTSNAVEDIAGLLKTPHETRNDSLRNSSMRSLRKGRKSTMGTPGHNISNSMEDKESIIEDPDNSIPLEILAEDISLHASHQEHSEIVRSGKKTLTKKLSALRTPKFSVSQNNTLDDSCISNHVEDVRELLQTPEVNKDESMKQHFVRSLRRASNFEISTPVADNSDLLEDKITENMPDRSENTIQEDDFKHEQSEQILLQEYPEMNTSCMKTPFRKMSMSNTQLVMQSEKRILDESCTLNAVEDIAGLLQTPHEIRKDSLRDKSVRSLRRLKVPRIGSPATDNSQLMEDMINVNVKNVEENPNSIYIFEENLCVHSSKQDTNELLSSTEKATNRKMTSNTPLMVTSERKSLDTSVSLPALDKADSFQTPNVSDNESLANKSIQSLRKKSKSVMGTPGFHSYNLREGADEIILETDKKSFPGDTLEKDISVNFSDHGHPELFNPAKKLPMGMLPKSKTPKELKLVKISLDDSSISNHVEDNAELFQVDIFNASSTNLSGLDDVIDVNSTTDEIKLNVDKCCNEDLQIGDKSDVIGENSSISISVSKNDPSTLHGRALFPLVLLSRLPSGFLGSDPTILSSDIENKSRGREKRIIEVTDVNNDFVATSNSADICSEGERTSRTTRNKNLSFGNEATSATKSSTESSTKGERSTRPTRTTRIKNLSTVKESETALVAKSDLATKSSGRRKRIIDETDVNNDSEVVCSSADNSTEGERKTRTTRNKKSALKESEATLVMKSSTENSAEGDRSTRTTRNKKLAAVTESDTKLVATSSTDNSTEGDRTTRTTRNKKIASIMESDAKLVATSSTDNSTEGNRTTRTNRNKKLPAIKESETTLVAKSDLATKSSGRRKQTIDETDVNNGSDVVCSSAENSTEGERKTRTTRNKKSALKESEALLVTKSDLATKSSGRRKRTIDETDVNNGSDVVCSSAVNSTEEERKTRTTRNKKSALKESEATLVTKSSIDNNTEVEGISRTTRNKKLIAVEESETALVGKSSTDNSTEGDRTTRTTKNKKIASIMESNTELVAVATSSTDNSTEGNRTTRTNRNKKLPAIKESETTLVAKSDLATKSSGRRKQTIDETDVNNGSDVVCSSAENSTEGERKTRTTRNKKSALKESEALLVTKSDLATKSSGRRKRTIDETDVNNDSEVVCSSADNSSDRERKTRTTRNKKSALKESEATLVMKSSTDSNTEVERMSRTTRNKKISAEKASETALVAKSENTESDSLGPPAKRSKNSVEDKRIVNDNIEKCESSSNAGKNGRRNTIKSYNLDLESHLNAEGKENSSIATKHQNIKKSDARKNSKKSVTSKRNTAQRNIDNVDDTADSSADNASYKSVIKSKVGQKKVNESIKVPGMTKTDEYKAIQSRGKRKVHFEATNNEIEKHPVISMKKISLRSKTK